jgi:hypothetical protein
LYPGLCPFCIPRPAQKERAATLAAALLTSTIAIRSRIAECQLIRYTYLPRQVIKNGLPILAVILSSALAFGFRRRIAVGIYTLFVGILRVGLRIKRFLNQAVKEASGSVEKNPPG